MFSWVKNYEIKTPGYFTCPLKFKPETLDKFIDDNLTAHASATAKYIEEYQKYEEVYDKVAKMLWIVAIEFH